MKLDTVITKTPISIYTINQNNYSRRVFIKQAYCLAISYMFTNPNNASANPLITYFFRGLAALILPKNVAKNFTRTLKPKKELNFRSTTSSEGKKDIIEGISKGLEIASAAKDVIELSDFLINDIWNKKEDKVSTLILNNNQNILTNTGDIDIFLKDSNSDKIEIQARIEPINIPPQSRLILDIDMSEASKPGIKHLTGYYGNTAYEIPKSSNIIIPPKNFDKKDINRMIEEFESSGKKRYSS